jgi:hypothetical protein
VKRPKQNVVPQDTEVENPNTSKGAKHKTQLKEKRKKKKKKEKWKYDAENTGGPYFFNSQDFPATTNGEYAGYTAREIRTRVGRRFSEKKRAEENPKYMIVVHQILDELGYPKELWKRKVVLSALSKEMWRQRKAKAATAEKRRLEDAQAAEINHSLPLEID